MNPHDDVKPTLDLALAIRTTGTSLGRDATTIAAAILLLTEQVRRVADALEGHNS